MAKTRELYLSYCISVNVQTCNINNNCEECKCFYHFLHNFVNMASGLPAALEFQGSLNCTQQNSHHSRVYEMWAGRHTFTLLTYLSYWITWCVSTRSPNHSWRLFNIIKRLCWYKAMVTVYESSSGWLWLLVNGSSNKISIIGWVSSTDYCIRPSGGMYENGRVGKSFYKLGRMKGEWVEGCWLIGHFREHGQPVDTQKCLEWFTGDILTISACHLFQNGADRMLEAYWR